MNYAYAHWPQLIGLEGRYSQPLRATSSRAVGRYVTSRTDFITRFYGLLRQWQSETAFFSDPDAITGHRCYKDLLAIGPYVTPLVIEELKRKRSLLVWLLDDIHGIQPYLAEEAGNISAMGDAWISWAERNGQSL